MTAPNIVLMILDDQTYESLSRTPAFFNKVAKNGVFFSNCFTNTSICQVARSTLLTGQYSHNHHIIQNETLYSKLDESKLLPKALQSAGYRTVLIGKYLNNWRSSNDTDPIPAGWTQWHSVFPTNGSGNTYYNYKIDDNGVITLRGSAYADYSTTLINSIALTQIGALTEPFFMQIAYRAPHNVGVFSTTASPDYLGCLPSSKTFPKGADWNLADVRSKPAYVSSAPLIDSTVEAEINSRWRGATEAIFDLNRSVGQIVDALVAAGKSSNTYIILVSDNGFFNGEQRQTGDQGGKVWPYESSIHVPLIISGPSASVVQNGICNNIVTHVDITATIYALSGVKPPLTQDGISLVPYLTNPNAAPLRKYAFIEWLGDDGIHYNFGTVRSKEWKYTEYATGEKELYNLLSDPFESTNLAGNSTYAATVAELSALVATGHSCVGASCVF